MSRSGAVSVVCVTRGTARPADFSALAAGPELLEVVVVRDGAAAPEPGSRIDPAWMRRLATGRHVGFAAAANLGAAAARGSLLLFLHENVRPAAGALASLAATAQEDEHIGAVAPLLLSPGRARPGACVVWRDGHVETVDALEAVSQEFRRDLVYADSACLLVRRRAFVEIGGFDVRWQDGLRQAADLGLALLERGWRVRLDPVAVAEHDAETCGCRAGARAPEPEAAAFRARWAAPLDRLPDRAVLPAGARRLIAARDALARERILVIDYRVPHHDQGGGDPRAWRLLLELARLWPAVRLTLLASVDDGAARYAPPLRQRGIEVVAGLQEPAAWFESRRCHYAAVVTSRLQDFDALVRATQPQALRVHDAEALFFRREDRRLSLLAPDPEALRERDALRQREVRALRAADLVWCVSREERRVVRKLAPRVEVSVCATAVRPLREAPGFAARNGLVFLGGFLAGAGSPNEDAVVQLVEQVLPAFWSEEPDAVLYVVGAAPTPRVTALARRRVRVTGQVSEPREWLARARLQLAPLRFGSGISLKLVESLAAGLPFVTSPIGAEGLGLDRELRRRLVARGPAETVRLALALYRDAAAWRDAQLRLLELAARRFSPPVFRSDLAAAGSRLGLPPPDPRLLRRQTLDD